MNIDDKLESRIEAGVTMLKWAREGKDQDFMWAELGRMGFSEKDRVDIAHTVTNFMKHKRGDHSSCPDICGAINGIADEFPAGYDPSVQECGDAIERRYKLHENNTFSDNIKEEWK